MASAVGFRSSSPSTFFRTMQTQYEDEVAQFAEQAAALAANPVVSRALGLHVQTLKRMENPLGNMQEWQGSSYERLASAAEEQQPQIFDTFVLQSLTIMKQVFSSPITAAKSYHELHRCLGVRAFQWIQEAFAQLNQFHPDTPEAIACSHAIAVLRPCLDPIAQFIPPEFLSACDAVTQQFLKAHQGQFSSINNHPAWNPAFFRLEEFHTCIRRERTLLPEFAKLVQKTSQLLGTETSTLDHTHHATAQLMQMTQRMDNAIAEKERVGSLSSILESAIPLFSEAETSQDLVLFCTMAHFCMSTYSVHQLAMELLFRIQKDVIEIMTNELFVALPMKFPSIRLTDEHKGIRKEMISLFTTHVSTLAAGFGIPLVDPEIDEASAGAQMILAQFQELYSEIERSITGGSVSPETFFRATQALEQIIEGLQHGDSEDIALHAQALLIGQQLYAMQKLQGAHPEIIDHEFRAVMTNFCQLINTVVVPWVAVQKTASASASDLGLVQLIADLHRLEMTDPETLIVEAMSKLHT